MQICKSKLQVTTRKGCKERNRMRNIVQKTVIMRHNWLF